MRFGTIKSTGLPLTAFLLAAVLVSSSAYSAQTRTMIGELTHVNTRYDTVVVEVPVGEELFTVAGTVASDAKIRKNGQPAGLEAFEKGETVKVIWHTVDTGHAIDGLVYPVDR